MKNLLKLYSRLVVIKIKTYLNSREKDHVVAIGTLAQYIKDVVDEWQNNLTANERKWLKMATSFALKAIQSIANRLSAEQAKQVSNHINKTKCICLPSESADQTLKRAREELAHEPVAVDSEYFNDILYQCLLACENCRHKTKAEQDACKARHAMMAMDIPVYDSTATGCPYEQTKEMK